MSMKSLIEIEGIFSKASRGIQHYKDMDWPTLDFSHISPVRTYNQKKKGQSALQL